LDIDSTELVVYQELLWLVNSSGTLSQATAAGVCSCLLGEGSVFGGRLFLRSYASLVSKSILAKGCYTLLHEGDLPLAERFAPPPFLAGRWFCKTSPMSHTLELFANT